MASSWILFFSISSHLLARKCFVREFKWLTNKPNKITVKLPLCPGTKWRNSKGADRRFVEINIQPSTCPIQVAGLQVIWRHVLLEHYALQHVRESRIFTPWSRVLLQKLTGFQLVKKFPTFYGTPRFITTFTSARLLSLSWATSIQSIPLHPTSWRSSWILPSHLCLDLPSGLFPPGFPTKTLYTPLPSPMPHPSHSSWFIARTILGEEHISLCSLCSFLHSPVTSSLLGPYILLNNLFSNTLSLRSSLNVSDQVSHPYKTTSKIIVLYIFIIKVLESKLEDKRFCTEWHQIFPEFNLLLISS